MTRVLVAAIAIAATAAPQAPIARTTAVVVRTELGDVQIDVDEARAPVTAANFLRYVDGGHCDGGVFHRTITLANQPSLDFGGGRNPDGQGFAAFGRVTRGMDVVRRIHADPNAEAQRLTPPIRILTMRRQ